MTKKAKIKPIVKDGLSWVRDFGFPDSHCTCGHVHTEHAGFEIDGENRIGGKCKYCDCQEFVYDKPLGS